MKRLILAYDDSEPSRNALRELKLAGLPEELEVMVLSVADFWMPEDGDLVVKDEEELPEDIRNARARVRAAVKAAGALAAEAARKLETEFPQWKIDPVAAVGPPGATIVKKARDWGADLIVVGSHGRGPIGRLLMGSVAQWVAVNADCSVHVTRPGRQASSGPRRIAVAVDGSPESERAVEVVRGRNWPADTPFQILTVLDPRTEPAAVASTLHADQWPQRHNADAKESLCHLVEPMRNRLKGTGSGVELHIFDGEPETKLLEQAETWGATCLFLGVRGQDHGAERRLGSTVSGLLNRAHCAVEIVR